MKQANEVVHRWSELEATRERKTWAQSLLDAKPHPWTRLVERVLDNVLSATAVTREASEGMYHREPTWPSAEHVASMEEIRFVLSFVTEEEARDPLP